MQSATQKRVRGKRRMRAHCRPKTHAYTFCLSTIFPRYLKALSYALAISRTLWDYFGLFLKRASLSITYSTSCVTIWSGMLRLWCRILFFWDFWISVLIWREWYSAGCGYKLILPWICHMGFYWGYYWTNFLHLPAGLSGFAFTISPPMSL